MSKGTNESQDLAADQDMAEAVMAAKIKNCLARYCRAIDRRDKALLARCYWPGAIDDHINFKGSAEDYIEWVMPVVEAMELTQHLLGQTYIEADQSQARAETYFTAYHRLAINGVPHEVVFSGRYLDIFEERENEWRIADRRVIADWYRDDAAAKDYWAAFALAPAPAAYQGSGTDGDPSHAIFARPRVVTQGVSDAAL